MNIPLHIGIIMDGNGRWAKLRGKKRNYGHRKGTLNVEDVTLHAFDRGVKVVSLYAFSSENWKRPKEEVDGLMDLLREFFKKYITRFIKKKVRLRIMGDVTALADDLQETIKRVMERTKSYEDRTLNIGINYGGRGEIVKAVNEILSEGKTVTEEEISAHLYTCDLGEPDLIIRTGGELRLSNFMLYQGAYAELYFTDCLWPDFKEAELDKALEAYALRQRRFGDVVEE